MGIFMDIFEDSQERRGQFLDQSTNAFSRTNQNI